MRNTLRKRFLNSCSDNRKSKTCGERSRTIQNRKSVELKGYTAKKIGPIARPDEILFAAELPKTRSGKIMRRLLRDIADGRALGDTTTLADPTVVAKLKEQYEEE